MWLDVCIVILILGFALKSAYHGLVHECSSLLGLILGAVISSRFNIEIGKLFATHIYDFSPSISRIIAFILAFALIWFVCIAVGKAFGHIVNLVFTPLIDRLLGFVFGACKAFIFCSLVAYAFVSRESFNLFTKNLYEKNVIFPAMVVFASKIVVLQKDIKKLDMQKVGGSIINNI